MEPERPQGPRPGALSDLEAKLLAARVGGRLFQRPAEPVQIGRYRLLGRLGQGGMSVVFRAEDPLLRREVAVKLLHSPRGQPDAEQQARLRREAHALGRLSHPNVVQVFEIGEADGQTFVVMELVRGTTLREWLRERPRTPAEVAAIAAQAGRGLLAAHAAGIIHRDFKPENVLVGADGRARVVDFGLARADPGAQVGTETGGLAAPLTRSGTVLGTPAFMAPEQLRDPGRADARSDQYSFCVLVYEALHGERPFDEAAAVRPAPAGSPVPGWLREALLRGLQPDPAARWPDLEPLLAALERAAATQGGPTPRRTGAAARRWASGLLAAALLLAGAASGWLWRGRSRETGAEARAAVVEQQLAALLAAGEPDAAARMLTVLPDPDAGRAWASWARMLAPSPGRSAREAWAHAYVLAGADAQQRLEALLGLAQARGEGRDAARVLALIEAEAPELAAAPEVVALREAARERDSARERGATGTAERDPAHGRGATGAAERDSAPPPASGAADAGRPGPGSGAPPVGTSESAPRPASDAAERGRSSSAPEAPPAGRRDSAPLPSSGAADLGPAPPESVALADRLAGAGVPREVVALARAGLLDLSAATLLTLAGRSAPPTRQAWQLAAAELHAAIDDDPRALALAAAAADAPDLRDPALALQVALLLRGGRLEEAARVHAQRLAGGGPPDPEAAALRDRLSALLAARADLPLRFAGAAASPWTLLEPAALRGDPAAQALVVTTGGPALHADPAAQALAVPAGQAPLADPPAQALAVTAGQAPLADPPAQALAVPVGQAPLADPAAQALAVPAGQAPLADPPGGPAPLAAWALELRADRLRLDVALEPLALAPGAALALGIATAGATAELALRVGDDGALRLACDLAAPGPPLARGPLALQLDVDAASGAATCRARAGDGQGTHQRVALAGRWAPGPARLELRGAGGLQVRLTHLGLLGAVPAAPPPAPALLQAGALLVDGDAHAAATKLADLDGPRARLWHAVALARLGRGLAPGLEQALAADRSLELELQRWLRADPERLGPALRRWLGERRYLELFAGAWSDALAEPHLRPEVVRVVLAELGGIDERCDDAAACTELRRAYGRALAQIGERGRAREVLAAALAAAPDDPAGRALASRLVLDLALVKTPPADAVDGP